MRVLIACEYSGTVRDAFRALGHDAMSCDVLPTDRPGPHYQGDVRDILGDGWDILVAHPPCTYLTVSGARWLYEQGTRAPVAERWAGLRDGAEFFRTLLEAPIPMVAVENPVMMGHARRIIGRGKEIGPTQYVQPWEHGHGETKKTGLWLRGLPPLTPSNVVAGRADRIHKLPPSPDRWKIRSTTYQGIADAMAAQWSAFATEERAS